MELLHLATGKMHFHKVCNSYDKATELFSNNIIFLQIHKIFNQWSKNVVNDLKRKVNDLNNSCKKSFNLSVKIMGLRD